MKKLALLIIIIAVGWLWYKGSFDVAKIENEVGNVMAKIMPTTTPSPLVEIPSSKVLMQKDAEEAFVKMQEAAKTDGVILIPHSGYRSISTQRYLWNSFLRKYGAKYTAQVLKPPGESEHQTGYALDIDDGKDMTCSLNQCFKNGTAFKWLTENASKFNFEISYPEGNSEGIAFEPWHWRFIGTAEAFKILKE
jgi:zinc D-Ala-D-Ala carboxypeptidase